MQQKFTHMLGIQKATFLILIANYCVDQKCLSCLKWKEKIWLPEEENKAAKFANYSLTAILQNVPE